MSVADVIEGRAKWHTLVGDVRETLRAVPDGCAQTCVTSPPYYGLRQYIPADAVVMRDDLSDEDRAYVLAELAKAGVL